jgi:YD repeat-containing protein
MQSTTNLNIGFRPLRVGILVRNGNIGDLVSAAGLNTLLAGGRCNPVIPVSNDSTLAERLIDHFDVDVLFGVVHDNRTAMNDGFGSKTYAYDQLSRMISETRTFNGVGTFTIGYDYNLAGELKKITDATYMTINYGYDNVGRLTAVSGSDNRFAGVSNYASNFQYRAWGGLKAVTDGQGLQFLNDLQFQTSTQSLRN